eukprot:scaffold4079_cov392-Prasinococcus_capsulatus_cf.AAC.2
MPKVVYVGGLPEDVREREVEDLFHKYGRIVDIDLKVPPRPPAFAFIEFEDSRDAEDACRGRDGYDYDGYRLRVELAHGGSRRSRGRDDGRSHGRGRSEGTISRRTDYRVLVTGLPSSASWQDLKWSEGRERECLFGASELGWREGRIQLACRAKPQLDRSCSQARLVVECLGIAQEGSLGHTLLTKRAKVLLSTSYARRPADDLCTYVWYGLQDHFRKAGDVCFTQVFRDGRGGTSGVVDFNTYDDMKYAIRNLDDTEFRNPFSSAYIRVKEDRGDERGSPDRSRSRSRDRDRDRDDDRRDRRDRDDSRDRDDRRDRRDRDDSRDRDDRRDRRDRDGGSDDDDRRDRRDRDDKSDDSQDDDRRDRRDRDDRSDEKRDDDERDDGDREDHRDEKDKDGLAEEGKDDATEEEKDVPTDAAAPTDDPGPADQKEPEPQAGQV